MVKKRDKIETKIKKEENSSEELYKGKLKSVRMGTPPMEERELTEGQKKFAMLLAKNVPPHIAQQQCEFSDFQRRTYLTLPKLKAKIQDWREIFALEGGEKLATLFNILQEEAIMLLRDRIKTGKITNQEIFKNIINKNFMPVDDDNPVKKTMKITQTVKPRQKQITEGSGNVFDGLEGETDEDNDNNEVVEKRELIIEETPKEKEEE